MTEQPLDPRALLAGIARRWLLIVGLVAFGTAGGLGLAMTRQPVYAARAVVLLSPGATDAKGVPARDMETEARVATGADVLSRAGATLTPPRGASALAGWVSVHPVSDNVLEVRARASTARGAAAVADAVATAYVETSAAAGDREAGTALEELQTRADDLGHRIDQLNGDVAANAARLAGLGPQTAEALELTATTDSLRGQATELGRELSEVNGQMVETRVSQSLRRDGTRVLRPATTPASPTSPKPARDAALGGMAGLLVGLVAGVITGIGLDRRRTRAREDYASGSAAAPPALASVPVSPRGPRPAVETSALRQALARLGSNKGEPETLVVVVQPGDRAGALLAGRLAGVASNDGRRTALVLAGRDPTLDALRATGADVAADLSVRAAADVAAVRPLAGEDLVVAVVVAGGAVAGPERGRRVVTVLAVSADFADAGALAATAAAWQGAGHPVLGVLVADPEPADPHAGSLGAGGLMPALPIHSVGAPSLGAQAFGGQAFGSMAAAAGPPPIVDLAAMMAALRRRRRLLAVTAVAGVLGAGLFVTAFPQPHLARATVLVGHPSGALPDRAIVTDVALAGTRAVAEGAAARLGPGVVPAELQAATRAKATSTDLVEISVDGPTTAETVRRAQAVTETFLAFRQDQFQAQWKQVADTVEQKRDGLLAEQKTVADQVIAGQITAAKGGGVEGLGDLQSRQASINGQLSILDQQLDRGNLDLQAVLARSRIVDPARAVAGTATTMAVLYLLGGLIAGLVLGTGWIVFRQVTDDKVRAGEDVLAFLQAPVALGVRRMPRRFRSSTKGAGGRDLARVVNHLARAAGGVGSPDHSLVLVSIGSDDATATIVAALATHLRDTGRAVLVADLAGGEDVSRLVGARLERHVEVGEVPVTYLVVSPLDAPVDLTRARQGRDGARLRQKADVVLAVASLETAPNASHVSEWASNAVVVVTAGRSTAPTLRSNAQMLAAAGIGIDTVVVVGADAADHTVTGAGRGHPAPSARASSPTRAHR